MGCEITSGAKAPFLHEMFNKHLYFNALSRAERSVSRGSKQIVTAQDVRKRREKMTNIKEKISERKNLIIAGALIALMAIGSTFAYFVDRDQVTNHFTANQDLFTYSVNTGWKLIKTNASTDSTEYIYAYAGDKMTALKPGETTATIFDTVKFINIVEEQLDGQSLDIQVDTMGIQTADLGTESPLEIYNIIMNQQ